jgi:hypothetical protein
MALLLAGNLVFAKNLDLSQATSPEEKGLAIASHHKTLGNGWQDSQSEITMIIRAANGKQRTRQVAVKALEVADDGDKSLLVFSEPRDVAGTAFLSYSHIDVPDDQWVYLPALKRVKRVASKNKSGAFMGSEFSYEDMSSFELEKYDFSLLDEETVDGLQCYVLEMLPGDRYSGYSRVVAWIDQEAFQFRRLAFYDKKQQLLKTLTLKDYELHDDKYWRPSQSIMQNQQNGKVTEMLVANIHLGTGLSENDFSQNSLKRAR